MPFGLKFDSDRYKQLIKVDTSSVHGSGALVRSSEPKEFDPNLHLRL
jgi:hypothetical protein